VEASLRFTRFDAWRCFSRTPDFYVVGNGCRLKMMEPSFEKLLVLLASNQVRFIVVGGIAVTLHGYTRLTEDVDILVDAASDNLARLIAALSAFGDGYAQELSPTDFDLSEGAIRLVEEAEQCQVDIFTIMSGWLYADIIQDAPFIEARGHRIYYASSPALIRWKSQSLREKDHLDASALQQLRVNPRAFD
jgi:hypothetical protein